VVWWLVDIAQHAYAHADAILVGRIGFFLLTWSRDIAPKMGMADEQDCGGIKFVPREAYAAGLGLAVAAMDTVDPDTHIVDASGQFVPAGALLPALSAALLGLHNGGVAVDPHARSIAARFASAL
jgi:hypothetical protein